MFPPWGIFESLLSLRSCPRQSQGLIVRRLGKGCPCRELTSPWIHSTKFARVQVAEIKKPGVTCREIYSLSLLWWAYKNLPRQRGHCNERDTVVKLQGCGDFFPVAVIYVPGTLECILASHSCSSKAASCKALEVLSLEITGNGLTLSHTLLQRVLLKACSKYWRLKDISIDTCPEPASLWSY